MAEKYKATPNNPPENSEVDLKKQKQEETKNTVEDVAKTAATAYLNAHGVKGPVADMVVNKAAENKMVQGALKAVSKNKQVQKVAEKAKPAMDMAKPLLDAKSGGKAGGTSGVSKGGMPGGKSIPGMSPKGSNKQMQGIPKTDKSSSGESSSNGSSGLSKGSGLPFKNPLSIGGSGSKESTEIKIIKFFIKHPYLLLVLLIVALIGFIILVIAFHNEDGDFVSIPNQQCEKVILKDGEQGVPLEEYVTGVIPPEADFMNDLVSYETLAIAARTFVMYNTKEDGVPCKKSIESSSNKQNYDPDRFKRLPKEHQDLIKQAVASTAGVILTDKNGDLINSEYDAFCYERKIEEAEEVKKLCGNEPCYEMCQPEASSKDKLYIPVTWALDVAINKEGTTLEYLQEHSHYERMSDSNIHYMSQYGLYYKATVEKKGYEEILHYFYGDDITIGKMVPIVSSIGSQSMVDIAFNEYKNDESCKLGNNGSKYVKYYGAKIGTAWCAIFVSWVANEAGYIDSGVIPKFKTCGVGLDWFDKKGQWVNRKDNPDFVPKPGDIIFYDWKWNSNGYADHVGIVYQVEGNKVITIEGNTGDGECNKRERYLNNGEILGYGTPAYPEQ